MSCRSSRAAAMAAASTVLVASSLLLVACTGHRETLDPSPTASVPVPSTTPDQSDPTISASPSVGPADRNGKTVQHGDNRSHAGGGSDNSSHSGSGDVDGSNDGSGNNGGSGSGSGASTNKGSRGNGSSGGNGGNGGNGSSGGTGGTGGTGASQGSVLSQRQSVPVGISAQLEYFQGGGDQCGQDQGTFAIAVLRRLDQSFMSTPDVYAVCIYGFNSVGTVSVTIRGPSGKVVESRTLNPSDLVIFNAFFFRRLGSDASGTYTFTAIQGDMRASTTLQVRHAQTPQYVGYANDQNGFPDPGFAMIMRPGATVRLALGGFKPNSTVQMRIYNNLHTTAQGVAVMDYLTSHSTKVDAGGNGILSLKTVSSDPEGCYQFFNEKVTRLMYLAPGAPPIRWTVSFCLIKGA